MHLAFCWESQIARDHKEDLGERIITRSGGVDWSDLT
jgi:hypothetical protein